jgi:hypothetical protein
VVTLLRKGNPVDFLFAGSKWKKFEFDLTGGNLDANSQVLIGGAPADNTTFVDNIQLTAQILSGHIPGPQMFTVQVRNSDGQLSNIIMVQSE